MSPQKTSMKMKELERVTGVGRETIRYYIREGLLPEPDRPKRNVAHYGPVHVNRLNLIKRLQAERHLPLHLIKTIVASETANPVSGFEALIGLEDRLGPLLSEGRSLGPRRFSEVVAGSGLAVEEARQLADMSFITIDNLNGEEWLNQRNARLLEIIGEMTARGYAGQVGYSMETYRPHADLVQVLAHRAVADFYRNLGSSMTTEEAAKMAADGIKGVNEILPLLFMEMIVREVEKVSQTGSFDADFEEKI
ncbi:MAG: MerR family transcriptional regulator [Parvibaculum sp.]|mgnify:CR=1 FL=1|nr:MerR family transcriptional regulator [Parvibaculum sp.]|tara:strand:- start:3807 stop:4559 length:753 start_codon:yes stop_codon:yes gene_type:complete